VRQTQALPSLGVMAAGALWGLLWFPLVEFEKQGLGVGYSSAIFYAVTAIGALPGIMITGLWRQISKASLPLLSMGIAFTLYTFALLLTQPFNAILLFYLTPTWSILLAKVLYGSSISLIRALVIILGFVGIGMVLGATSLPIPKSLGDWIALLSGALWALGTSLASREVEDNSWVRLMQFSLSGLAATAILAFALSGHAPKVLAATANTNIYLWAALIGLVLFAIPNLLVIWGTSYLSSARVGVLLMMEVVVGTIAIALLSAEPLATIQIAGAVLIFAAGIVEVISRDSNATTKAAA
jgi:drug/metabolite transporter (DMT)-like permease